MPSTVCLWVVVILCFNSVQSQPRCPLNEIEVDCVNPCNNCEQRGRCTRPPFCRPGCDCRKGFFRDRKNGRCIPENLCKNTNITCPPNEIIVDCVNPCNTCEQRGRCVGLPLCRPGCDCRRGFFRDGKNGRCIPEQNCRTEKCPKNAIYLECGSECEPTCENPVPDYCNDECVPGCFCLPGLLKNEDGQCVYPDQCDDPPPSECGKDEQYYDDCTPTCKNTCENYNNPDVDCKCDKPGCFCAEGLVKRSDGKCVPPKECTSNPYECGPDEQYYDFIPDCTNICAHLYMKPDIPCPPGPPGCFCKKGLVKNDQGKCVYPEECPVKCDPDEEYYDYMPNCKNTCENYNSPRVRCKPGPPGCFCKEGLVKRKDGKCVDPQDCPAKCYPDEQYYEYTPNCKNTCENYNKPNVYCKPGPPGCFCKEGLVKRKDGKCVDPQDCPAKCPPNEQYYEYTPNCKNTCENYNNPGVRCKPGPPGCFCKDGLVKRKDGKCVDPRECPVKCPPDEQYYEHIPDCKNTCDNCNNTAAYCKPGPPGCFCKEGLVKRKDGKCVDPRECPVKCPPDEQYYEYIPSCKNTCENYNNTAVYCKPGPPGCFCKEGLVKRKDGKCVNPRECPVKCPPDEQYYKNIPNCKNTCENCNNSGVNCPPGPPGCFCKEGLVKRKDGKCVKPQECPAKCPPEEQYYEHMPNGKNTCENYDNPKVLCESGPPGCFCKIGLVKRKDGKCVDPRECPGKCLSDEQYFQNMPNCKNTCENYNNPSIYCPPGPSGCFCKEGLVKRKDGKCVTPEKCPAKCPPDEQYYIQMPKCKNTCENYNNSGVYCSPSTPGCFCKEGLVKRKDGKCVKPEDCPAKCGPDEQYYQQMPNCKNTCENYNNSGVDCPPPPPGCFCKKGLVKRKDGKCVLPQDCTVKCFSKEQYYDYMPNCKNTCENYNKPDVKCPLGPPGCFCKKGLVKREDGRCVHPRRCIDKCLPYEQYYENMPNCKNTCENFYNYGVICPLGPPGCFCRKGLLKRKDGRCVLPRRCQDKCPPEEQYYDYRPNCKNTCENYSNPAVYCATGTPGCFCRKGLVKRKDGKCVNPRDCQVTPKCPKNATFVPCATACPATCQQPYPGACKKPCVPRCVCNQGFLQEDDGTCVKPNKCKKAAKCPKNSTFMECSSACPATCKNPFPGPCTKPCVRSCVCNQGYLEDQRGNCVLPHQCKPKNSAYYFQKP